MDVCAPGEDIYGPAYYDPSIPGFDSYFYSNTGTSFAAPMVSGLAALVKAVFPSYGPDEIRDRIKATADNIDRFNPGYAGKLGAGRINCARALGVALGPRPPTNLQAYDTPQDDGGSITVTWTLSADDGAGANSVTGYVVLRRQGQTGEFQQIAQVAAGTDHYEDTSVDNAVDYYYKVGATDGQVISYAGPVGPVQAQDNNPPPPVDTLVAIDRPGDDGGAIQLSWTGYQAPADCIGYRVYRDQYPFDNVGGRQPIAEITNPTILTYTDQTVTDFTDYYYAVTAIDGSGNENENVTAVGPVQSMPNDTMTVQAGIWLMSSPVVPADGDPATLFGNQTYFKYIRWDNDAQAYQIYEPGGTVTPVLRMELGRGFWLWTQQTLEFAMEGQTASSGDWAMDVEPGWRLLGNPYFAEMDYRQTQVQVGQTIMDLFSAEQDGYLSASIFVFDPVNYSYQMISPTWTGPAPIPSWTGFWMRIYQSCRIIFRRPAGTSQLAAGPVGTSQAKPLTPSAKQSPLKWKIRISAVGRRGADRDNYVGVSEAKIKPAPEPPAAPGCPRLWIEQAGQVCSAVAHRPARVLTWRLVLQPAADENQTWIEFDIPDDVARDYAIILRERESGRAVDVTRQRRVEVAGPALRHLQLQAVKRSAAILAVTTMFVKPAGRGAQIVFSLSVPARCDVEIMNIAGRTVRRVRQDWQAPAGQSVVVWDGRSATGAPVPRGMYLVRLKAKADDGMVVQQLRSVTLTR